MNFKPTKWKFLVSVLAFIVIDLLLSVSLVCLDAPCPWHENVFHPLFIIISLVALIVAYVVWSLIEKK